MSHARSELLNVDFHDASLRARGAFEAAAATF
jgi:hypothetical protein